VLSEVGISRNGQENAAYPSYPHSKHGEAEFDYNLSVSTHIEKENTTPQTDIKKPNAETARIAVRGDELRRGIAAIIKKR